MTAQSNITPESIVGDLRYLQLLSRSFPTIADASTEIINLEAILNLPKGTEHFLTDIHGEYEAFQHVLKNASGAVKRKVNEIFGNTLREAEKKEICTLIYYPNIPVRRFVNRCLPSSLILFRNYCTNRPSSRTSMLISM